MDKLCLSVLGMLNGTDKPCLSMPPLRGEDWKLQFVLCEVTDMKEFSVGAKYALLMAKEEAKGGKHQFIEKEHIFIGICSLEKGILVSLAIKDDSQRRALKAEYISLEDGLLKFGIDTTQLRRLVRDKLSEGNCKHNKNDVIEPSQACKEILNKADELAGSASEISCLHLLTAVLEGPGAIIKDVLDKTGVDLEALRKRILGGKPPYYYLYHKLSETAKSSSPYFRGYGSELTQTRTGRFEIILGVAYLVFFISHFVLGLLLPKEHIREFLDRLHEAAIISFIPLLVFAEIWWTVSGLAEYKRGNKKNFRVSNSRAV